MHRSIKLTRSASVSSAGKKFDQLFTKQNNPHQLVRHGSLEKINSQKSVGLPKLN